MSKKVNRKSEFKAGFKSNSLLAIVIAFLLCACLIIGLELFIGSGGLLKISDYATSGVDDDRFGKLSYYVYDDINKETDRDRIYYFGGSSAYNAISYDYFRQRIKSEFDQDYLFVPLSSEGQGTTHALVMLENLPKSNGVAIISTHYAKMFYYEKYNKMYLKSDQNAYVLDGETIIKKKNYSMVGGIYLRRFLDRLLLADSPKKIFAPVKLLPIEQVDNVIDENNTIPPSLFEQRVQRKQRMLQKDPQGYADIYRQMLLDMIEICEQKGLKVVLMDAPMNVDALGADAIFNENSAYTAYDILVDEIAQQNENVYHSEVIWDLGLKNDVFLDDIHITNLEARQNVTDALIEELKIVLK
jgi:hypothetical protein